VNSNLFWKRRVEMKDLIKINYDDYYKFLVSTGIVGVILLFAATLYSDPKNWPLIERPIIFFMLFLLFFVFFIMIIFGVYFWQNRQKKHDTLLDFEVNLKKLEIDEKNLLVKQLDLQVSETKLRQRSSELRRQEYAVKDISKKVE